MICLVSVIRFFAIIAFYGIDEGYWFLLVFGSSSLLTAQFRDIGFCWFFAIIAFYSIVEGYWFVSFFESSSLFRAQSQNLGSCVFSRNSFLVLLWICWMRLLSFLITNFLIQRCNRLQCCTRAALRFFCSTVITNRVVIFQN